MNTFKLTVASPDGNKFSGEIVKLDVRGTEGELAVMAGHIPFVTSIVSGACAVWLDETNKKTATTESLSKDLISLQPDKHSIKP